MKRKIKKCVTKLKLIQLKNALDEELKDNNLIIDISDYEADGNKTLEEFNEMYESTLKFQSIEENETLALNWYDCFMKNNIKKFLFGVSQYPKCFYAKPDKFEISKINYEIANCRCVINIDDFKENVGKQGCPFMCGWFENIDKKTDWIGRRKTNFVYQQIWALDFDEGISFYDFLERATRYKILPIFVYKTFSCDEDKLNKFRAIWIADFICTHTVLAESISKLLMTIFPEADKACKDVSRIFFGGKGIIYENDLEYLNRLDLLNLVNSVETYIEDTEKKHRLEKVRDISSKTHICLNGGVFDLKLLKISNIERLRIEKKCLYLENSKIFKNLNYDLTVTDYNEILNKEELISDEVFYILIKKLEYKSNEYFCIRMNLAEKTVYKIPKEQEVKKSTYKEKSNYEYSINRIIERGIKKQNLIEKCKLCKDFFEDEYFEFNVLLGLCTNLMYIEGGLTFFKEVIGKSKHNFNRATDWIQNCEKINRQKLYPTRCINFCPYALNCKHGKNIIQTVKTKRNTIVVIDKPKLISLDEGQEKLNNIVKEIFKNE